jgi:hypothetical protein
MASPDAACPGLPQKHLDASIRELLLRIAPAAARATGKQNTINKYTYFAGHFDEHGNALVRNHAHRLMEEVQGFTGSHWTPPSGKYYVQ